MSKQAKAEEKAPDIRCEQLCSGAYPHGLKLAKEYGVSVESAEREHRRVHELWRERLAMPGGASAMVAEAARMAHTITETQDAIGRLVAEGYPETGRVLTEQRGFLKGLKSAAARGQAALDALPPEAKTDPARAVADAQARVAAARAVGDRQRIADAARELDILSKRRSAWHADSQAIGAAMYTGAMAAHRDLSRSLTDAFKVVQKKVVSLTNDGAFLAAPELIDVRAVEKAWREAGAIAEAINMLNVIDPPDLWSLFDGVAGVPADYIAGQLGLGLGGRVRENVA